VPEALVPTGDTVLFHIARFEGDVPGVGAGIHGAT
jgi:hypothetical protein